MILNNRKSLAQNFMAKAHLAVTLVNGSTINLNDIVYEIGPGNGRLTRELAKRAKKIIAIEKDYVLYTALKKKFELNDNIILHHADFLKFKISEPYYKVFANVPFNITSAVIRKILYVGNPPTEAFLIMQKEAAEKFTGERKTTQFSVLAKPWFKLKIIRHFKRTDFSPVPNVDVVMLHIEKRPSPLILPADIPIYEKFVKCGFNAWRKNLRLNYRDIFSHHQWKRLSRDLEFSLHAHPSDLSFWQWLGMFEFYRKNIYVTIGAKTTAHPKHTFVRGARLRKAIRFRDSCNETELRRTYRVSKPANANPSTVTVSKRTNERLPSCCLKKETAVF